MQTQLVYDYDIELLFTEDETSCLHDYMEKLPPNEWYPSTLELEKLSQVEQNGYLVMLYGEYQW